MEMLPVTPQRRAKLEEYAQRHGKDAAEALDEVLADYFAWEEQDCQASVEAVRRGYEDMKTGRTQPLAEVFKELRKKHDLPR